jgi:hypothetical protein
VTRIIRNIKPSWFQLILTDFLQYGWGWLLTVAAWDWSNVRLCGTCGGQSGTGVGFLWVLRLPPPVAGEQQSSASCLLHAVFLLSLLFDYEDGGDTFLWNICWLSLDYVALYPRRQNSSKSLLWEPQILYNFFPHAYCENVGQIKRDTHSEFIHVLALM